MVVIFDVVGTLFSLDRARQALGRLGAGELLDLWFARLLQSAMAATLAGEYRPFSDLAASTLRQLLARRGLPAEEGGRVLEAMGELEPWPDAAPCLRALREGGHRILALTNSGESVAQALLGRSGLIGFFEAVLSCDEAGACKPHPAPYELALKQAGVPAGEACMVAAHGWDVLGAAAAGLRTVWISRLEGSWPFPGSPPHAAVPDLASVPAVLGKPAG